MRYSLHTALGLAVTISSYTTHKALGTNNMIIRSAMHKSAIYLVCLVMLVGICPPLLAQLAKEAATVGSEAATVGSETAAIGDRLQQAIDRLGAIRAALNERRAKARELQTQLKSATDDDTKKALQVELSALNESVAMLNASFEQVAVGGINLDVFSNQPTREFNWQNELIEITRPLFASLNELTEKPRAIEKLKSQLERYEDQLLVVDKAMSSITAFGEQSLPDTVREKLESVATAWQQRKADTENAIDVTRYQLASLHGEHISTLEAVKSALQEFFTGRGLTLGMALATALVVWILMRLLLQLFLRWIDRRPEIGNITRNRLALYGYRALTGLLIILSVITVFYLRGDLLLLALSILGLVMLLLTLRQTLPRYIAETRLLLDVGTVRTGERVIYKGIPMKVRAINVNTMLNNPELEGVVRLPLGALIEMISRPAADEPWFSTRVGEFVMWPDGKVGQVLRQTLEVVQVKIAGSPVLFDTANFHQLNLRNLSREGFGLAVTFGIDYRHQAICLERVPAIFAQAVRQAVSDAGLAGDLLDLLVEFKEAGASSLDYLIYLSMKGSAANAYFKLGRLIQQTCVDVCNGEDWGIPFAQMTIHRGEGFDPPPANSPTSSIPAQAL